MAVYLDQEGYCLGFECRVGQQHGQKNTSVLFKKTLQHARLVTSQPLLLRLDGGHNSIENIDIVLEHNRQNPDQTEVDCLIKWNPRRQDKEDWLKQAQQHAAWTYPREGKWVWVFSHGSTRHWRGYDDQVRQIIRFASCFRLSGYIKGSLKINKG